MPLTMSFRRHPVFILLHQSFELLVVFYYHANTHLDTHRFILGNIWNALSNHSSSTPSLSSL